MSKKKCHQILYIRIQRHSKIKIVAPLGLEPRHTEPESAVLPLHNRALKKVALIMRATFCFIWLIIQAC